MNLFPWQVRCIRMALPVLKEMGGYYVEHDPGMGKTLTALCIAKLLGVKRITVLTPKVGLRVWKNQIRQWWPSAGGAIITRQGTVEAWLGDGRGPHILVTNYDQIRQRRKEGRINPESMRVTRRIMDSSPELVILDEAHYVKTISSAQHKAARAICSVADYRLMLSGTPAHSPLDWHPQYNLLVPLDPYWGKNYTAYKSDVTIPHPTIRGALNTRAGNKGFRPYAEAEAQEMRIPYTHVARSDEMHVPEPIHTPVPFELDTHERRVYREMDRHLFTEADNGDAISAPIALTKYMRLHQITGGWVTNEEGEQTCVGSSKIDACMELIQERENQKIIVACRFRAEITELLKRLEHIKRSAVSITGATPGERRAGIEQEFQTHHGNFVLILQYRAGGMSLTLTAARTMILYSFEPSVIQYRQMIGRGYRIGSTTNLEVLPLLGINTIDEQIYDGLKAGLDAVDLVKFIREQRRRVV